MFVQKTNIQNYAQTVKTHQNAMKMINFGEDKDHYNV